MTIPPLSATAADHARAWAPPVDPAFSWGAVFAGASVALAVSTVLTLLAAGFGLSLASSGLGSRTTLDAFNPTLGAIAVAIQVVSAGLGGYLAGRLRGVWRTTHLDEAHFRDTAHGLVAWAVSTLAGLVLTALVFAPYAEHLAGAAASAAPATLSASEAARAANVAAQSAFFMGFGMLLSGFIAAVAGRVGGLRNEEMHARYLG